MERIWAINDAAIRLSVCPVPWVSFSHGNKVKSSKQLGPIADIIEHTFFCMYS